MKLSNMFDVLPMSAERPRVKASTKYSFQSNLWISEWGQIGPNQIQWFPDKKHCHQCLTKNQYKAIDALSMFTKFYRKKKSLKTIDTNGCFPDCSFNGNRNSQNH